MLVLYRWLTRNWLTRDGRAPVEAVALRTFGLVMLVLLVIDTFTTKPHAGLHGRGLAILALIVVLVVAAVLTQPTRASISTTQRLVTLLVLGAATAALAALQPNGFWPAGAYFVGIIAAIRLERVQGMVALTATLIAVIVVSAVERHGGAALSASLGTIPWYLVMRLMSRLRREHGALEASRAAEARAAAAAERGRLAREMHDVLAHSLSALALQLESTRLLARDRGADPDLTRALDQAHHLAASGLEEARRAIATQRGDELPGPERIEILADAFGEQSGLPVAVAIEGPPRELPADARLAVYRTAQEALTNVRRHATPERVEVRLAYLADSTVLVVEDHVSDGTPPPVALGSAANGYGLTGMRERAELLGGQLLAEPTASGFRVELRLPA